MVGTGFQELKKNGQLVVVNNNDKTRQQHIVVFFNLFVFSSLLITVL